MKIVIIGPAHPLRGGIADTNESFCDALLKLGHEASIVSFSKQYPSLFFPGKTQYSTDPKPEHLSIYPWINSINPLSWFATARKIKQLKPDIVIIRYWLPFLAPSLGTIARRINKTTVLLAMCDNVIPHEKRMGDRSLTRYFTKSFDAFITLSKTTFKELDEFTSKPKAYFPHPINHNLGKKIEKAEARRHLELNPTNKYLLFFGLIRKYKGLDLSLAALALAIKKDPSIHLLVVGEFYEDPERYHKTIQDLGLKDHVIIINEFVPTAHIKYYFSAADLVVQTYHTASQSGITQIAYNFDSPILVTDVGGLSEVVGHQKHGYVSQKDPVEIAKWICDFFANERFKKYSANVAVEKQKYSWSSFSKKAIALAEQIEK